MRKNLTVFLLYRPSSEVRGKMRRYFYEVKANTFVGTVSAGVRDILWQNIIDSKTEASLIYHTNSEQGFEYKSTKKDESYIFEDFDGIILPTTINSSLSLNELYAKPDYLLLDHILDVGYIAEGLMKYGRAYTITKSISKITKVDFEKVVSSIAWLCALHDIGKAHPYFVTNMYKDSYNEQLVELYESLLDRGLLDGKTKIGFRHERFSRDVLKKYFAQEDYPEEAEQFADLVAYHHQGKNENDFADTIKLSDINWLQAHNKIIDKVNSIWSIDKNFSQNTQFVNGVLYSILSIMVTADWIASGKKWRDMIYTIPDKSECARKFIEENELLYTPMSERFKSLEWSNIFDFNPNDMQTKCIKAAEDNPSLMIVEYPCGGGKTEAALSAAIKMGKDKSGIYIATPTMSTAKGMTLRMNELAEKIELGLTIPEFDSSVLWSDEDMNKIPSDLWVSKSRHRMLYPSAVGTVDQILKTMLSYRYACIGLMGLSDKVLIIDEVHAYDSYMLTEIKKLIKWCKFLDIPLILLSATLPTITKVELLTAAGCRKEQLVECNDYPLLTTFSDSGMKCIPIDCTGRTFKLNILEVDNYEDTWNSELAKHYDGCSAFIEGTVDNTWSIFRMAQINKLNPILFTGRDTLAHKEQKTTNLIEKLGKHRENRPNKMTVVATSIIEQSLDIDLDRMFTCIAPIDLLIQRFGRVWRHSDKGTIREHTSIAAPITIIIPKESSKMPSKIYGEEILNRTISVLKGVTEIDTVKDARWLIDTVYDSIDLIKKLSQVIKASYNSIDDPNKDAMFDNNASKYSKFKPIQSATRYETYPSVSIAIVEPGDIENIEENYKVIQRVMRENVIGISTFKAQEISIAPIKFNHKLINDVNFYYRDNLKKQNIELTEDGLKWNNN